MVGPHTPEAGQRRERRQPEALDQPGRRRQPDLPSELRDRQRGLQRRWHPAGAQLRLEALWDDWQARHLAAVSRVVRHMAAAGELRPDLDDARAADVMHVLSGSETYRQLVVERGWPPAQFEEWLADSVRRLVVAEP